ncbi:MAG: ATP-binding protein [Kouleothrix sp.]|nr:ATP-binding protein [Kouleothrix sp.]
MAKQQRKPHNRAQKSSPPAQSSPIAAPAYGIEELRAAGERKYRQKEVRRVALASFEKGQSQQCEADRYMIAEFLLSYQHDLDLVREALQPLRSPAKQWCETIFSLLDNPNCVQIIQRLIAERQSIAMVQKKLITTYVQQPLVIPIDTTSIGPDYASITANGIADHIRRQIPLHAAPASMHFQLACDSKAFVQPGPYQVSLTLPNQEMMLLIIELAVNVEPLPDDLSDDIRAAQLVTIPRGKTPFAYLVHCAATLPDASSQTWTDHVLRFLKTAHSYGYWKTGWVQNIVSMLRRARKFQSAVKQPWLPQSDVLPVPSLLSVTEPPASQPASQDAWSPIVGERQLSPKVERATNLHPPAKPVLVEGHTAPEFTNERDVDILGETAPSVDILGETAPSVEDERLLVLDLPPLVSYDLRTAKVDLNVLQHLFHAPHLQSLRGRPLEEFTDNDIRNLSYAINREITNLNRGIYGVNIGTRVLAMIQLSVARLQFERLEIGSSGADIRFCLSGYSTRMGEYLIEQHHRYDSARDYYLEAVSLNSVASQGVDFPTRILFQSCIPSLRGRRRTEGKPFDFRDVSEAKWRAPATIEATVRSFIELGRRHYRQAEQLLDESPEWLRTSVIADLQEQLKTRDASFANCVTVYKQIFDHFESLLKQMQECGSSQRILYLSPEFRVVEKQLGTLLSPTNREIIQLLIEAIEMIQRFLTCKSYEDQRSYSARAIHLLDNIPGYGADKRTALWAAHFSPIAQRWRDVLKAELSLISSEISPVLRVLLAEAHVSLDSENQGRVIFRVENIGAGTAEPVNINFRPLDPSSRITRPARRAYRLEPNDVIEGFFNLDEYPFDRPLSFTYDISYYDPDRKLHEVQAPQPLVVQPLLDEALVANLKNPFRTDKEVDDARLFVGRDVLLDEVCSYAVNQSHGGLLMLYGQKRVGKSSLLLFLEKRINELQHQKPVVAVRVTWLDFSAHNAAGVIEEIILAVREKYVEIYQRDLPIPSRTEIQASYSLAFNDLLRTLMQNGVKRLVLLVDEFDVIVNQLDLDKGFDRMFFEYLRGLSKRGQVALVLTGGEMMPLLFERFGEIFNHDRTWRIAYLSPTDGSVEALVKNDYVRDDLHFSDDAIEIIKRMSDCNPCFVQMICKELVDRARFQRSLQACRLDVIEASDWLVRQPSTINYVRHLYSPFHNPDPLDLVVIGVVVEEELKGHKPSFVAQQTVLNRIRPEYHDRVVTKIGELVRREILVRNPDSADELRVALPLFRDWFNDNKPEYNLWAPFLRR